MTRFPANEIISTIGEAPRYDLSLSVGPHLKLHELLAAFGRSGLGDMPLGYGTAAGDSRLRNLIAASHGVEPEDVVITMGGMHALFLVAFVLCGPGDEAVTTSPSFPLGRNALKAAGATMRTERLSFDKGYRLDAADLIRHLSEQTKLVSLASPQNPSGVAIPTSTLCEILDSMAHRCPSAYLLVDETYREATYGDDSTSDSAVAFGPRVLSIASLSKCHGAPGLRLGWVITRDPELREQLVLGKYNTVVSCSPVDEALAFHLLEQRNRIMPSRSRHLAEGLAQVSDWVRENACFIDWIRPDAGTICCVRLKPAVFDEVGVRRFYELLTSQGVRVGSGAWFGEEARVFRLGFGFLPTADLAAALQVLGALLKQAAGVAV